MLTLHHFPGTVALATHITLRELGLEFQLNRLDFPNKEQRGEAYAAVNPKGRVPALETPEGVLTETPAVLTWLAQTHPQAGMAPENAWDFGRLQEFMAYLCSTLHVSHAHGMRGHRWADREASWADMKAKIPETMGAAFAHVEMTLDAPWVMGARYSVADPYLFTVGRWLEGDGLELADFPKVAAHRAAMLERPAVRAALEAEGLPAPPVL